MNLEQYAKNLFIILWNIIIFLCPFISQNNTQEKETPSFLGFTCIFNVLNNIYKNIKELTNKITSKLNNTSTANTSSVAKYINKNKIYVSNRVNSNNSVTSQAIKSINLLYMKRLKDAQATQNLISNSKQHIFPIQLKLVVYQALMFQLNLSYIKVYSDDIRKVMTITQDKCAYFSIKKLPIAYYLNY